MQESRGTPEIPPHTSDIPETETNLHVLEIPVDSLTSARYLQYAWRERRIEEYQRIQTATRELYRLEISTCF